MKEKLFIDTGFWIALLNRADEHHETTKNNLKSILKDYSLYSSEFIVFETITYLNCSIKRHDLALQFLEKVKSNSFINTLEVDVAVKNKAIDHFVEYDDQNFSFTDCTSFAAMKLNDIKYYAGFDGHFNIMGFLSII